MKEGNKYRTKYRMKYRGKEGNIEGNTFGEGEFSFGDPSSVRKPESVSKASSLQLRMYSVSGKDIELGGGFLI